MLLVFPKFVGTTTYIDFDLPVTMTESKRKYCVFRLKNFLQLYYFSVCFFLLLITVNKHFHRLEQFSLVFEHTFYMRMHHLSICVFFLFLFNTCAIVVCRLNSTNVFVQLFKYKNLYDSASSFKTRNLS